MSETPTPLDLDAIRARANATITPAERAAMRRHYEPGPMGSPERTDVERKASQGLTARADVPRLLDALDAAEADRDEARAASERVREAAARCVADEAAESELTITRQRDRLRAREEQVRRLRAEVTRLHALVADLRSARPAPAWDEDAVVEGMARAVYPFLFTDDRQPLRVFGETRSDAELREGERNVARERMRQALAVVREHLPVKPNRETVARAIDPGAWRDEPMPERPNSVTDEEWGRIWDRVRTESKAPSLARADAALDLWPGESRAQVEAAALRDAADEYEARLPDGTGNGRAYNSYTVAAMLRARADRLAAEGGADRG